MRAPNVAETSYDILVVGAGPGGSTTALFAASQGLSVAVLDKSIFPRDKICGDLIPIDGLALLAELGLLRRLFESPHAAVKHLRFTQLEQELRLEHPLATCRRRVFDDLLIQEVRRRCEVREGWLVRDLLLQDGQVTGVRARRPSGEVCDIHSRIVIGADGVGSVVARKAGLYRRDLEHWGIATRSYHERSDHGSEAELHYLADCDPGYLWTFPVDGGLYNVGVAILGATAGRGHESILSLHRRLLRESALAGRVNEADCAAPVQSWSLPLGSARRPLVAGGVLLVGDAGGLIDPLFGHGIDTAMISGKLAAQVSARAIESGDCGAIALAVYEQEVHARLGPTFDRHFAVRVELAADRPWLPRLNERVFANKGELA